MEQDAVLYTDFKGLKLFRRGKVRDVYDLEDKLLIVSTDRISCFDVVLPSAIPFKGKVLTAMSCFWFNFLRDSLPNHFLTIDPDKYPEKLKKYKEELSGRSMLVLKAKALAVECIVRGYIAGSAWKEYQQKQSLCGIKLPSGLKESQRLPEIIFTPSTKAETGHDRNVDQRYIADLLGKGAAKELKDTSIDIYRRASEYAGKQGIIIADTKFEFGIHGDSLILIDEVLTPDSSRFWPLNQYTPGRPQPSFDKQFVRDYLETLDWDKTPPAPKLPEEIIQKTSEKYLEAYKRITGRKLAA